MANIAILLALLLLSSCARVQCEVTGKASQCQHWIVK